MMRRVLFGAAALLVGLTLLAVPAQGDPEYDPACDMDFKCLYLPIISSQVRNPPAPVPKTGQTVSYATGDDGDLQKGVIWPDPRFTDNGDGAVTDNLTGLIWLKNADCFGRVESWASALLVANALNSGQCGLSDGSSEGDWRLPNVRELFSLMDLSQQSPALPSGYSSCFTGIRSDHYWTSTTSTYWDDRNMAWNVHLNFGEVISRDKTHIHDYSYVWPVRDGAAGPAPVPKTGQTKCYNAGGAEIDCANTGQDGDLQRGVAWPDPRFTDNGDGTVTDNLTGLIWLKNANCFGPVGPWASALLVANTLNSGECGLSDGSSEGDWRLPNVRELFSLMDFSRYDPALPSGHPFDGAWSWDYRSSTTVTHHTDLAWYIYAHDGRVIRCPKTYDYLHVWPVRGGQ